MAVKIRQARLSDICRLKQLQGHLVKFELPFDETIKPGTKGYYAIKRWVTSKKSMFAVAEDNGKVVGCGFGRIMKNTSWSANRLKGHIGLMFVEKEHRGKGIGREIMRALFSWFRKNDISDVRLQVYAKNKKAIKAYSKYGFEGHILEMRKKLSLEKT